MRQVGVVAIPARLSTASTSELVKNLGRRGHPSPPGRQIIPHPHTTTMMQQRAQQSVRSMSDSVLTRWTTDSNHKCTAPENTSHRGSGRVSGGSKRKRSPKDSTGSGIEDETEEETGAESENESEQGADDETGFALGDVIDESGGKHENDNSDSESSYSVDSDYNPLRRSTRHKSSRWWSRNCPNGGKNRSFSQR